MEQSFKDFLISYVVSGHTVDDDVMNELNRLTDEFIDIIDPYYFFTKNATGAYIDYLDDRLSDENRHWFPLRFDKSRYHGLLEKWIKWLLKND